MKHLLLCVALMSVPVAAQTTVTGGLLSPIRITMTLAGNLVVCEAGQTPSSGRISLVDRSSGSRRTLVDGLPSSVDAENGSGTGPTAAILRGNTLYVLVGQGNVLVTGSRAGTEVPNPAGPSSPIFSSLLAFRSATNWETLPGGFTLAAADQLRLADGLDVMLDNGAGAPATAQLVTDFRDVTPDPNTIVRGSNPFAMDFDTDQPNMLYVVDSGNNLLSRVDIETGRARTLVRFPPLPNPQQPGPPVMDAVPTSVHAMGDSLLVTFLTGYPFAKDQARVVSVNRTTGATGLFIANLSSAMDVARVDLPNGTTRFYTLEFSADFLAQPSAPGRLRQYDTPTGVPIASGLITPTSMAVDPRTGDVYVSELGTGRIVMVRGQ